MNTKYFLLVLSTAVTVFCGCKKATEYYPVVYFTDTEQYPEKTLTVDGPESIGISITSSIRLEKPVVAKVEIKPDLVAEYNKKYETAYEFLPANSYMLEVPADGITIPGGTNRSEPVSFDVTSLANFKEGVTYCVPISITGVSGDMAVLESSRTLFLIVKRTIITQAASLASNRYFRVPSFQTDPTLAAVPNLTIECRVLANAYQTANPFISSIIGIEENFLLRFGDVSIANNQLQLAGGKVVGSNKFPVTSKASFSTGQWIHVAVVYNGATNALYINGVLDNYTDAAPGGINLTDTYSNGFLIGSSAGSRYLNGAISEARVWSRALSAKELANNLCYVPPTSPGLIAYWRFNGEITGLNVTDLTGHGHTAIANNTISWINAVRCP